MSEKREKQTKSKRRIWRGVTTATASLLTLSMSATLVIDGFRTDIDKFLGTQSTKMVTEDVSAEDSAVIIRYKGAILEVLSVKIRERMQIR